MGGSGDTSRSRALPSTSRRNRRPPAAADSTDDALLWGLGFSGRLNLWDKDNLRFHFNGGDGIGRYLLGVALAGAGSAVYDTANNELDTVAAYGGYLAYQHYWIGKWRSNLVVGFDHVKNPGVQANTRLEDEQRSPRQSHLGRRPARPTSASNTAFSTPPARTATAERSAACSSRSSIRSRLPASTGTASRRPLSHYPRIAPRRLLARPSRWPLPPIPVYIITFSRPSS